MWAGSQCCPSINHTWGLKMASIYITMTYPEHNTINIKTDITIEVMFNRDVNQMTIPGNFNLYKKVGEEYIPVAGDMEYQQKKLTFVPKFLEPNTEYQYRILSDMADVFGNTIGINESFNFVTKNEIRLEKVVIVSPNDNIVYFSVPSIDWTSMDGATNYEIEISTSTDFSTLIWNTTASNADIDIIPIIAYSINPYFVRIRYTKDLQVSPWSNTVKFFYHEQIQQPIQNDIPLNNAKEDAALEEKVALYELMAAYDPLFCTPKEVIREMGIDKDKVDMKVILSHIHNASIYAKELREYIDGKNPLLTNHINWDDVDNLPIYIKQFVKYQAAYDTLYSYYVNEAGEFETITLSDLEIDDGSSVKETMNTLLRVAERKIQPWKDALMNFGLSRGYGMPSYGVKGQSSNPYPDYMTREITEE